LQPTFIHSLTPGIMFEGGPELRLQLKC